LLFNAFLRYVALGFLKAAAFKLFTRFVAAGRFLEAVSFLVAGSFLRRQAVGRSMADPDALGAFNVRGQRHVIP